MLALPSAPGIAVPRNSPPEVFDDLRVRALACCALPAWRGCRKFHCRWRRSTVARSGSRLLPRAATIRSCSN